jgi:hypothetical protein
MSTHNPYIEYYVNQALGKTQTGHGFYTGLPWQKGYGIGGLLGSLARRFIPLLKPLAKSAGKKLLRAGTSIVSDLIDGQPVSKTVGKNLLNAGSSIVNSLISENSTKKKNNRKYTRTKRPKISNIKRRGTNSSSIPNKRRRRKQDIFYDD